MISFRLFWVAVLLFLFATAQVQGQEAEEADSIDLTRMIQTAKMDYQKGIGYTETERFDSSNYCFLRSANIYKTLAESYDPKHWNNFLKCKIKIIWNFIDMFQLDSALIIANENLGISLRFVGYETNTSALIYDAIAEIYLIDGYFEKSLENRFVALQIRKNIFGNLSKKNSN